MSQVEIDAMEVSSSVLGSEFISFLTMVMTGLGSGAVSVLAVIASSKSCCFFLRRLDRRYRIPMLITIQSKRSTVATISSLASGRCRRPSIMVLCFVSALSQKSSHQTCNSESLNVSSLNMSSVHMEPKQTGTVACAA